jgi:hypothetical protein
VYGPKDACDVLDELSSGVKTEYTSDDPGDVMGRSRLLSFELTRVIHTLDHWPAYPQWELLIQEDYEMTTTVWGGVREGRVVPSSPLPEGAHVEIRLADPPSQLPEDLQAEFEAWHQASDRALDLVERLAQERGADEAR